MTKRILVAYATGTGSTGEVAAAIAEILKDPNVEIITQNVDDVQKIDSYSGFVIGSSIRAGRWLPAGIRFIKEFGTEMSNRPVAYFTTCLTMVNDNQHNRKTVMSYMEPILTLAADIQPVGIGLFAGSLDPNRIPIMEGVRGPHGDYRNWDAIKAWAAEIKPALLKGDVDAPAAKPYDLSQTVLSFTDLSDSNLSHVDLHETELYRAILHHADLSHANLQDTDLTSADLTSANLEGAHLHWSNLESCNLQKANLHQANLIGADLKAADLRHANLEAATLNGANLKQAQLQSASLKMADLNWADLSTTNLTQADLTAANLGWADLRHANLEGTTLTQARYNAFTRWPEDFSPQAAGCVAITTP